MFHNNNERLEKEYKKDPDLRRNDVKDLLEWVSDNPHLPKITEFQAILFLHSCYYNVEEAKKVVDAYFTFRTANNNMFEHPGEDALRQIMNTELIQFLPKPTPEGYMVILVKSLDNDVSKYNFVNQVKVCTMVFLLQLQQFGTCQGLLVVHDLEGFTPRHLFKLNIFVIRKALYFIQETLPVRIKGIHFTNLMFGADKILNILRPFMKKELRNILFFHDSMESAYNYIPKNIFPADYGGDSSSIKDLNDQNIRNVLDNIDFFEWHNNQKVDERKRKNNSLMNKLFSF